MPASGEDPAASARVQTALSQLSATALSSLLASGGTTPDAVARAFATRALATALPAFAGCAERGAAPAPQTATGGGGGQRDGGVPPQQLLRGIPVVLDGSLCASRWRRWGCAAGLVAPVGAAEVAQHPVAGQLLGCSGATLVGVSNISSSSAPNSGAIAAVACGNSSAACLIDDSRGGALTAAAITGRIVALHPSPATTPHVIHPEGEHYPALHWHATLLARSVEDLALLYDALYTPQGWGSAKIMNFALKTRNCVYQRRGLVHLKW